MIRHNKRKIIILIYIIIFACIIAPIIMLIIPNATCTDGKLNQNEDRIDCGGVCRACPDEVVGKDLVITRTDVLAGGDGMYDVVATLHNPNALFGGKVVYYTVEISDSSGHVLAKRNDKTFILPNENKYIVEIGLVTAQNPSNAKVSIDNVEWVKFTNFDSPQIIVRNQHVGLVENSTDYAEALGLVSNESTYDFHNVVIHVIILDERGVPIAVNQTVQNTLNADSQREFRLTWPHKFPGTIKSTDMQAEANVYDSLNYVKKFIPISE